MKLTLLTNPNPVIQEKMRFFADYFHFVNEFLGRLPELPFDNPFSLIDKIKFQLENNLSHAATYMPTYITQLFAFYAPGFDKSAIGQLILLYKQFSASNDRKQWLIDHPEFYTEVERVHSEFELHLFDDNFTSLFSYLQCPHRLKKHLKNIQFSVQILVSQFRLNGYSKAHVGSCIGRILSHDNFPFPASILKITNPKKRASAQDKFLKGRDLKKQFFGLKNLLERPSYQSGYFIYAIEGAVLEADIKKNFKVEFDKVTFISPFHLELNEFRLKIRRRDKDRPFQTYPKFFGSNRILAIVKLDYDTVEHARESGLKIVRKELQQFNLYLNADVLLNDKHYLFSEHLVEVNGGQLNAANNKETRIRRGDYEYVQKNVYSVLRNIGGGAKTQILHNEDIFFRAIAEGGVAGYWRYLENVM